LEVVYLIIAKEWSLILGVEGSVHIAHNTHGVAHVSAIILDCKVTDRGLLAIVRESLGTEGEYFLDLKEMELHQRPPIYYHISQQGMLIDQDTSKMARVMYDLCSIIGTEAKEKGTLNIDVEECMEGYREALQDYEFDVDTLMRLMVDSIQGRTS
jgi:hypothetical protein